MTKPMAEIVTWVENRSISDLAMIFYWWSIAITFICEIAAITILAAISTNNLQDESEGWMAVWFFAVDGGIVWIVAHQCFDSVHRGATRSQHPEQRPCNDDPAKRNEIALRQLHVLKEFQGPQEKPLRLSDVKAMFLQMRDQA